MLEFVPLGSGSTLSAEGPAEVTHEAASHPEVEQLREQINQLRTENQLLAERQRRIMELIGTNQVEHLIHDIRNVLNERELLRTLAESQL